MNIGDRIKEARLNAGLSQDQAAEKIMVSRQTVSNWENGKSLPDIASILTMSDLYQISLDELLKGDPKMKEKAKKDTRDLVINRRLAFTAGIISLIVSFVYLSSIPVGGDFHDFCEAALPWILMGLGVAFCVVHFSQSKE